MDVIIQIHLEAVQADGAREKEGTVAFFRILNTNMNVIDIRDFATGKV